MEELVLQWGKVDEETEGPDSGDKVKHNEK